MVWKNISETIGEYLYKLGTYLPADANGKVIPEEMLSAPDRQMGIVAAGKKKPRDLIAMITFEGPEWPVVVFGEHNRKEVLSLMGNLVAEFGIHVNLQVELEERREMP